MTWIDQKLEQNSDAWYAFRHKHLGASQVPSVMGTCDFRTAKDLFEEKINPPDVKFSNYATDRGKALEPLILSIFESKNRCFLSGPVLTYEDWPTLSASLDGFWKEKNAVIEVKAPSRVKHIMALCELVPTTYIDQVQAQLLVTGADKAYYVSFHDDEPEGFNYAEVEVFPDLQRQKEILETCKKFWAMLETGVWNENWRD